MKLGNDIREVELHLPVKIEELAKFVLVGREKLVAVRAEIRAIDKIGHAREVRDQKLSEAQAISEAVLDAEVRIGELIAAIPEVPGKRTDIIPKDSTDQRLSKREVIKSAGFSVKQAQRFETLAAHPDVVASKKAEARDNEEIVSWTAILQAISEGRKPYIINNSHDGEWYTPDRYIQSARKVMGNIDLDPASCGIANQTVQASKYYTRAEDGLKQVWAGNVWLNPPYSDVQKFIAKLLDSEVEQAIVLVNNATETAWFKALCQKASAIVFHTGRLRFVKPGSELSAPMQGQAFVYIGNNSHKFLEEFLQYGWGTLLIESYRQGAQAAIK